MKLRDLFKCNIANDGTRTLTESILVPEVASAFKDWVKATPGIKCVVIGGVALSYYAKPRTTTDGDLLFMDQADIPAAVPGFKRHRPGAFLHLKTHVEMEVLSPASINMDKALAQAIYDTANVKDNVRIASPSGLVAAKLGRFKLQDQADIEQLYLATPIDLTPYPLSQTLLDKYNALIASL